MRKAYVIAEGAEPTVVLKKVQKALDLYYKYGCFALKKRSLKEDAFVFDESLGQLCLSKIGTVKCQSLKAERIKVILEHIKKLMQDSTNIGIRENLLHYYLKKDVQEEGLTEKGQRARFSHVVLEISAMLRVLRESLKIRGAPNGLIQGDLQLYTTGDKLLCDCRHGGQTGTLIPSETDLVTRIDIGKKRQICARLGKGDCILRINWHTAPRARKLHSGVWERSF